MAPAGVREQLLARRGQGKGRPRGPRAPSGQEAAAEALLVLPSGGGRAVTDGRSALRSCLPTAADVGPFWALAVTVRIPLILSVILWVMEQNILVLYIHLADVSLLCSFSAC